MVCLSKTYMNVNNGLNMPHSPYSHFKFDVNECKRKWFDAKGYNMQLNLKHINLFYDTLLSDLTNSE